MRFPQRTASDREREELMDIIQKDVKDCYQCMKCSSGCPFIEEMDYKPHQMIKLIKLGLFEKVLKSESLWICASCMACSSRCPRDIEPAKVFEGLRVMMLREKDQSKVQLIHKRGVPRQALIASMRKFRR
ncbi:4Fe-4S dicluster domain-containing protein [Maledivibacter halophilus]|uniref:Heterodisulfide reductase subunit C n=1 Tax=Maledivibacter halophilus TaxID=36842 RepID=A0A1T5LLT8_9FIRM|nr:4Fe-4S dicluster domain-containing protein [Maledivibacter halophilus]SKC76765.1 heterodisulfide reductase subunit C [Maledivibacter halophilus]